MPGRLLSQHVPGHLHSTRVEQTCDAEATVGCDSEVDTASTAWLHERVPHMLHMCWRRFVERNVANTCPSFVGCQFARQHIFTIYACEDPIPDIL